MPKVYIGLGSNIGNAPQNISKAIEDITALAIVQQKSPVYCSSPWGYTAQRMFYNQVIQIDCQETPHHLLYRLQVIEKKMGKKYKKKWGPRIIDIDMLYYNHCIIYHPQLKIPHPYIAQRRFVLVPLCAIAPQLIHPQTALSQEQMLLACKDQGLVIKQASCLS